jgi:hypothetical protein
MGLSHSGSWRWDPVWLQPCMGHGTYDSKSHMHGRRIGHAGESQCTIAHAGGAHTACSQGFTRRFLSPLLLQPHTHARPFLLSTTAQDSTRTQGMATGRGDEAALRRDSVTTEAHSLASQHCVRRGGCEEARLNYLEESGGRGVAGVLILGEDEYGRWLTGGPRGAAGRLLCASAERTGASWLPRERGNGVATEGERKWTSGRRGGGRRACALLSGSWARLGERLGASMQARGLRDWRLAHACVTCSRRARAGHAAGARAWAAGWAACAAGRPRSAEPHKRGGGRKSGVGLAVAGRGTGAGHEARLG